MRNGKKFESVVGIAIVLLAHATFSYACVTTKEELDGEFLKKDLNKNGVLEPEEFKSGWSESEPDNYFKKLDVDRNEVVDRSEYTASIYFFDC